MTANAAETLDRMARIASLIVDLHVNTVNRPFAFRASS
jgi:hypothetical protein